jgi:hypothetical protein
MQKNYTISCCAECPAFVKEGHFCKKRELMVEQDTSSPVDSTLVGSPDWCPLPDAVVAGNNMNIKYRKIARQILKCLDLELDDDSVTSIAHYLSTVVEIKDLKRMKGKKERNKLFPALLT